MKKLIYILLLVVFAIPAFELHQFWKIKNFIFHYNEHKSQNADLGVVDFILLHYTNQLIVDDDVEKDMELPFKSFEQCFLHQVVVLPSQMFSIPKAKIVYTPSEEFALLRVQHLSEISLASVWQPPRA